MVGKGRGGRVGKGGEMVGESAERVWERGERAERVARGG